MEEMIGTIKLFAGNFAPRDWLICDGRELFLSGSSGAAYQPLASIIDRTYGGTGSGTTGSIRVPDLRGRVPVGFGQGQGLSTVELGEKGGVENVTLLPTQIPAHTHQTKVVINAGNADVLVDKAGDSVLATQTRSSEDMSKIYTKSISSAQLRADAATVTENIVGNNQSHENRQPYLGINYIICYVGIYPSRD